MTLLLALTGCCVPLTWPSEEGAFDHDLTANLKLKTRERQWLLPGVNSTPPPPEPAVTSGQCDELSDGGPVAGPGCITSTIQCGDTIIGHTAGGVDRFDTRFYEKKFCWPGTVQHDGGGERVYKLEMPSGEWRAFVWMDSPCADLDLFALKWDGDDCPTEASMVRQCEAVLKAGKKQELVELVHQGEATWYVVVEGRGAEEGAFALHIACREGLQ